MSLVPSIGAPELFLVAVVALLVVGPKDLPKLMRAVAGGIRKARAMAAEFTAGFEQMAREAEMAEMREEIERLRRENPIRQAKEAVSDAVRPVTDIARETAKPAAVPDPAAPLPEPRDEPHADPETADHETADLEIDEPKAGER